LLKGKSRVKQAVFIAIGANSRFKYVEFLFSVGTPIPVEKVPEPTQQQISELHQKFTEELKALFETKKHMFLTNPETTHLMID
jgi:hypothetical protein